jgi:hypothetical protein
MRLGWLLVAIAGCGGPPLLAKVPHPNKALVAGGAAAVAAAVTLADPDAASRRPEQKNDEAKRPVEVRNTVPADVLDRLDRQQEQSLKQQ